MSSEEEQQSNESFHGEEEEDADSKLIRASDVEATQEAVVQPSEEPSPPPTTTTKPEIPDPSFLDEFGIDLDTQQGDEEELDEEDLYFKTPELKRDVPEVPSILDEKEDEEKEADDLSRNASYLSLSVKEEEEEELEEYVCDKGARRGASSSTQESLLGAKEPRLHRFNVVGRRKKKARRTRSEGSGALPKYKRLDAPATYPHFHFSPYLKEKLGAPLVECLTEIAIMKPHDPVAYLANWLNMLPKVDKARRKFTSLKEMIVFNLNQPRKVESPKVKVKIFERGKWEPAPRPKYNLKDAADTEGFLKLLEDVGVLAEVQKKGQEVGKAGKMSKGEAKEDDPQGEEHVVAEHEEETESPA